VLRAGEDPRFLTGGDRYIDNIPFDGAAEVAYVYATVAHARIAGIDTTEARAMPGVLGVYTASDVGLAPKRVSMARVPEAMVLPLLATDTVRFVGELVAAVVAETRTQAVDAAEAVIVDYEPLPSVVGVEAALATGAPLLFPEAGTNVALHAAFRHGDEVFDGCEVVVRERLVNQRVAVAPMEARAALAWWDDDDGEGETGPRLHQYACTQGAHGTRSSIAKTYGLEPEQVHVIAPDVGGGFGGKSGDYPEEVLLGWFARDLGRPVRWAETRTQNMLGMYHGRAQVHECELGGMRDGTLVAYRLRVLADCGAYPFDGVMLPYLTRLMAGGVYALDHVDVEIVSLVTNTTPIGAFRGAGRPEATAAIERMVDRFALEIGMDATQVRRANFIPRDAFPYTTLTKAMYDSGDYEGALDKALALAGYEELRKEQARRRAEDDPRLLGIGVSSYVEITNGDGSGEFGAIEVTAAGGAIVHTGTSPHGQGHHTAFAMIAAELTGIPFERIEVRHGDTDVVPRGGGTGGSRSLQAGGSAVWRASESLVETARTLAADLLEADPTDVVLDRERGAFHVAGTPAISHSWADLATAASTQLDAGILRAAHDFEDTAGTFPFGTHVAVVEIDRETGAVTMLRHVACDDAGTIINPVLFDGQVHGGVASGISQALYEDVRYDDDGNPLTTNFLDYCFPSAAEFPSFERVAQETPSPLNPLGAKGVGEAGTIGATPAVQNAVVDALSHLGVTHLDMPCTPERIWEALRASYVD
jgi:carbon-monoxide dehydrogenase large subunit